MATLNTNVAPKKVSPRKPATGAIPSFVPVQGGVAASAPVMPSSDAAPKAAQAGAPSRQVDARWTPKLAAAGWTPIADFFLDNYSRLPKPLKYSEAMFVIHLLRHKWDGSAPHPGFNSLSMKMGISPQAARAHARTLESKGYLKRLLRVGMTNRFDLSGLFAALEEMMVRVEADKQRQKQILQEALDRDELPEGFDLPENHSFRKNPIKAAFTATSSTAVKKGKK